MKQVGIVVALDGDCASVKVRRESACDGCHAKGVCSSLCPNTVEASAVNCIGAEVGDTVELETASSPVLLYSALTFVLPVVLGFLGYLVPMGLGAGENPSLIFALVGALTALLITAAVVKIRGKHDLEVRIVRIVRYAVCE